VENEELSKYVARARDSLYFSGARIDTDLTRFLAVHADACEELGRQCRSAPGPLFLVGSGGSYAALQTAKYILDGLLSTSTQVLTSYELIWRQPRSLGRDAVVLLASYSGETEDTVAAARYARASGARTIAIVGLGDTTLARESDTAIVYGSSAIYEIPIVALVLFAAGLAEGTSAAEAALALRKDLHELPDVLRRTLPREEALAEQRARSLLRVQHVFVLGAGPMSPLAYKLAMSVFMENIRISATFCDSAEWRHGPAEALERLRGTFIVLLGTDPSREISERAIDFCRSQGSEVSVVYDAAAFGKLNPLLAPVVMNSHTQWLIVYSAILRGIVDLDARVFMGHHVLAAGGARWP
jgi:fructoselysine 6-phosphate deglycase